MTTLPVLYTTGYLGDRTAPRVSKVASLARMVEAGNCLLYDIRMRPWSRAACWRGPALQKLLGSRYVACPELGNVNYNRDAPIEILNLGAGMEHILTGMATGKRVLLLCGCEEAECCHRKTVALAVLGAGHVSDAMDIWRWDLQADEWERRTMNESPDMKGAFHIYARLIYSDNSDSLRSFWGAVMPPLGAKVNYYPDGEMGDYEVFQVENIYYHVVGSVMRTIVDFRFVRKVRRDRQVVESKP